MQRFTKTTSRTVAWLKKASDAGSLVLAAPYQRNPVWTDPQKSSLIETILLEYPVPELYMQDIVESQGDEQHIIVDGQQRTRAVLDFINGDYSLTNEIATFGGSSFDELPLSEKKKIFEYDFVVRVLPEMAPEQIRSIFQRINRNNVVLNSQELRHATYWGSFIKTVENLADDEFWEIAGLFTANERRRMLDAEYVSELSIAALNGLQNKKTKLDDFYQAYELNFEKDSYLNQMFRSVLGEIRTILPDIRGTRWKKKSDFYTLFLIFADIVPLIPFSRDGRDAIRDDLEIFGRDVTSYLSGGKSSFGLDASPSVIQYADNVERAASDLSSRRKRRDALLEALSQNLEIERARLNLSDESTSKSKASESDDPD